MLVRSVFSSYYRLLAGLSLALMAIALTGCNELAAEKVAPSRYSLCTLTQWLRTSRRM